MKFCFNNVSCQLNRLTSIFYSYFSADEGAFLTSDNIDTSSDAVLAQMLQTQFDKEYDAQLLREEKKFNGDSKGKVA